MTNKTIKIGHGIGELKLGMDRDTVVGLIGEPTEAFNFAEDEDNAESQSWHYDEQDLSLNFEMEDDFFLTAIAVSSTAYTINGVSLIGVTKAELAKQVVALNLGQLQEQPVGPDEILAYPDNAAINFWLDGGIVREIQLAVEVNEEGEVLWP